MRKTDGPPYIEPESLAGLTSVTAGFSTRRGGVSEGPYRYLNLGLSTGDDDDRVLENRRLLFEPLGIGLDRLAVAGQLTRAGLSGGAIEISDRCTLAEADAFYSHRAEQGITGRMMGFILLHPEA